MTEAARAAILVGGASRRLGRDKARVEVGGERIVDRVVHALLAVVPEVFLVGKAGGESPRPDLPFVADPSPGRSALAGLVAALRAAAADRILVVACDHPFLAPALLGRLLDRLAAAPAAVPRPGGRPEPLVAAWRPADCLPELARRLVEGRFRLSEAAAAVGPAWIEEPELRAADPDLGSFLNVNDEGDLARAREKV